MWKYLKIRRVRIGRVMLAMLLLGAYVPTGYMPAGGAPFRVELCPAASLIPRSGGMVMPRGMHIPTHHHSGGKTSDHPGTCPFGSAPAAGPWVAALVFLPPSPAVKAPAPTLVLGRLSARALRTHQARAPPSFSA